MSDAVDEKEGHHKSKRLDFPGDEKVHPWLCILLDAFVIADEGVAEGIRSEIRRGRQLACGKGCSACCRTHKIIPVYPLELVGISWFATEKLSGTTREQLKAQLFTHQKGEACPFLVDGLCSIHDVRPMECRQFNVFGKVCEEGEDAYYTRRQDVLTPIQRYTDKAFFKMLPFYGVKSKHERRKTIKEGHIPQLARILQELGWSRRARKMEQYDQKNQLD